MGSATAPEDTEMRDLTPQDVNGFYKESLEFIRNQIDICSRENKKCVILTHHAPTDYHTVSPEVGTPTTRRSCFTPLESLLQKPVVAWCFGHTHVCAHFAVESTVQNEEDEEKKIEGDSEEAKWLIQIASNAQGYITSDGESRNYSPEKVVQIPPVEFNDDAGEVQFISESGLEIVSKKKIERERFEMEDEMRMILVSSEDFVRGLTNPVS